MKCSLARFSDTPCRLRADGNFDPCHWIPKQRLIAEYRRRDYPAQAIEMASMDPRVLTPGCRVHHDELDGRTAIGKMTLEAEDYPPELHAYAGEYCWYFVSPREGWVADRFRYELANPPGLVADFEPLPASTPAFEDEGKRAK